MEVNKCNRCGKCCNSVGRTFWKAGCLLFIDTPIRQFGDCKELNDRANNGDHEDGKLPCEMLAYEEGKAVCLIEKNYGRRYKPTACEEFLEEGEKCSLGQEQNQGQMALKFKE